MTTRYQFDAFQAQRDLRQRMADFLLEIFGVRDPALAGRLRRNWTSTGLQDERLIAPMLVEGAFPFRPGLTLRELCSPSAEERDPGRPLHPRTVELLERAGMTYPLYEHQVEAIRAASRDQTLVLSAGTGSGKTEAFLVPLLDRLIWDHEVGLDDLDQPGIRALIIYPLNALVNNQMERILGLLRGQTRISFSYYTSRLKEDRGRAERYYHNRGRPIPPECQILDRRSLRGVGRPERSRQGPPHILVTNFAMLEYMLIRPLDRSIFEHVTYNGRPRLRAIVLDEAHVYAGAQATEIHMLLRRAAHRFGTSLEDIQGFATSATLSGMGSDDAEATLRQFASDMFASAEDQVAVVVGKTHLPDEGGPVQEDLPSLHVPQPANDDRPLIPQELRTLEFDQDGRPRELVRDETLAHRAAGACATLGLIDGSEIAGLVVQSDAMPARLIHHVIARHPRLVALRAWLFHGGDPEGSPDDRHGTRTIDELASRLYPGQASDPEQIADERVRRATHAILQLGSLGRLDPATHPFIPSRMHLFVRSPAGVWVDPRPDEHSTPDWPWGAITSHPRDSSDEDPWLALCLCKNCGAPLLQAWFVRDADWGDETVTAVRTPGAAMVGLFPDADGTLQLDEAWGGQTVLAAPIRAIDDGSNRGSWQLESCPRCARPEADLERMNLSARAALPVLIDAVYPSLGAMSAPESGERLPGDGRRLLTFSDSRQGTARVAAEVERSHDIGLNRQILWRTLCERAAVDEHDDGGDRDDVDGVSYQFLHEQLVEDDLLDHRAECAALDRVEDDETLREDLARLSVYEEFARPPARGNTLETLGLVEVVYPRLPAVPAELSGALNTEEWHALLATILDDARRRGAVKTPTFSSSGSLHQLLPRARLNRHLTFAKGRTEPDGFLDDDALPAWIDERRTLIPLIPSDDRHAGRMFDLARRLCVHAELSVEPEQLLRTAWDALVALARQHRRGWLTESQQADEQALQIKLDRLKFRPHPHGPPLIEPVTGRVYFRTVRSLSPERASQHSVHAIDDQERARWRQRHAVRRVLDHAMLALWSVEHTAQLDVDDLEEQERAFRAGQCNLMASSTTMEMGVDLGGLTLVVLTNVPPGPANYWQRAGRAGRRADGSSLVITSIQPRPHDQRVFGDPRAFLEREITPPRIRRDTRQLLLRHVYAFLLTAFYQRVVVPTTAGNPMNSFGKVSEFLLEAVSEHRPGTVNQELVDELGVEPGESLGDLFARWLITADDQQPLGDDVTRLVCESDLAGDPLRALFNACRNAFARAMDRIRTDLAVLEQQRAQEEARGEGQRDERFLRFLRYHRRVLENEPLISYLARSEFLPRFGFPLDVVRLDSQWRIPDGDRPPPHPDEDSRALRLERGLDIALAEYAPGSDVIAKKRVYRVAGLQRDWSFDDSGALARLRYYVECVVCYHLTFHDTERQRCDVCGHPAENEGAFLRRRQAAERQQRGEESGDDVHASDHGAPPSPIRSYLEPVGFAVKLGHPPRRVTRSVERMPGPRSTLGPGQYPPGEVLPGELAMGFTPESPLFTRSEGLPARVVRRTTAMHSMGYGYRICQTCGLAEAERAWGPQPPERFRSHRILRGSGRCRCNGDWKHAVLGLTQTVDAYRVRLLGDLEPREARLHDLVSFYLSLAVCVQIQAAQRLNVDSRTLRPAVATYRRGDGRPGFEAVIYDTSASGMLAHLDECPLELMRDIVDLLEYSQITDFVRFDTQYLIADGQLRIPELRRHFVDNADRKTRIQASAARLYDDEGVRPLTGRSPRAVVQRLFDDPGQEIALQIRTIAPDAFDPGRVMRRLLARVVAHPNAVQARILLGELPGLESTAEALLLATWLRDLINHGVAIKLVQPDDLEGLDASWPAVLSRSSLQRQALGGMGINSDGQLEPDREPAFGRGWLRNAVPVVSVLDVAAEVAWSDFEERWRRGTSLSSEALSPPRPAAYQWVFQIPERSTARQDTELAALLQERTELGELRALGQVQRLVYTDRYVARSPMAMWRLDRLLALFDYAPGATGEVRCLPANDRAARVAGPVRRILAMTHLPPDLDPDAARLFRDWCIDQRRDDGLEFVFRHPREVQHQRKLTVAFAPGNEYDRMVVLFEHGLDWIRPARVHDNRPWTQQPMQAEETHIVVLLECGGEG